MKEKKLQNWYQFVLTQNIATKLQLIRQLLDTIFAVANVLKWKRVLLHETMLKNKMENSLGLQDLWEEGARTSRVLVGR